MKFFAPERSTRTALQLSPVATGCAIFIAALAAPAVAQEQTTPAAEAPITTVTVTGIRRGIEDAISVKKDSSSIVEAISAEDIGKLPDVSIAESIARLPGLAAQRVAGRAQVISVRGLSPDFSTTLLNGREQVSTGDNRSVEFDQYPSELLSGVTIYKTPDAGLIGQGLSGTIDLQTVRPLNFGKRTVAMNARAEHNSLGSMANTKSLGNRFSISYIDQFLNRKLGVAIGFAHLESPVLANETGIYEPWKTDARTGLPAGTTATDGIKALSRTGYNRRDGLMGVVEYRPSKQFTSTLDFYASIFKHEDTANQFEVNLSGWNGGLQPEPFYSNLTKNGNAISTAVANNVYPLVRGMFTERRDDIRALGWNNEWRLDGVKLVADLSWSKAKRDELGLENNLQLGAVNNAQYLDTVNLAFKTGTFPSMAPGRNDYSDSANLYVKNTIYGSGYGKVPYVEDELKSVKLAANFQAPAALENWFSGFDVGVNHSDRSKDKDQPEGNINLAGNPTTIDPSLLYGSVDLGFAGIGNVPAWDVPAVVARYMTFNPTAGSGAILIKNWSVREKISTAYAKANIEHEFGDISLRGNFGVQVQHTKQFSDSKYFNGALAGDQQVQPIHDGKSYNDWLPSMNLNFGLPNDQTVRVAMAKQIARPRVDQLRAALDFGVSDTTFKPGASGGNAQLDPWRAKAFDLSYEKYFGKKAYVAAAFFFKKLDTYIFTQTKTYDFSAFVPGTKANTVFGDYKAPYNGNGGVMRGLELSGSLPLNMLTPVLDGFGIVASGTYTDSNIAIQEPDGSIGQNIPLPGLSKRVTNLTVYYEKNGFETRLSQRKRSDFVGEIGNFAAERSLRYVVGESILDFQIGYTFQNGPLKDMGIVLQANNLRNAAYETYNGSKNQQLEYQKYGRTLLLGVNYKF